MKALLKIFGVILGCFTITAFSQELNPKKIFKSLDEASKSPTEVRWLSLEGQQINFENFDWSKFKNLEYLSFKNDHLKELPRGVETLTSLKILDLSGNELTNLPESFSKLQRLEELYLDNSSFDSIETTFGILSLLPNLKRLHLASIDEQNLPENIAKLTHLEELEINNKIIKKIPIPIQELPHLKSVQSKNYRIPIQNLGTPDLNFGFAIKL